MVSRLSLGLCCFNLIVVICKLDEVVVFLTFCTRFCFFCNMVCWAAPFSKFLSIGYVKLGQPIYKSDGHLKPDGFRFGSEFTPLGVVCSLTRINFGVDQVLFHPISI
jgi:hypothetical protein